MRLLCSEGRADVISGRVTLREVTGRWGGGGGGEIWDSKGGKDGPRKQRRMESGGRGRVLRGTVGRVGMEEEAQCQ